MESSLRNGFRRIAGLGFAVVCALAWACLISWSATDPALTAAAGPSHNYLGRLGAYLSDWTLQCLGFAAALALFAPSTWAAELLAGRRIPSRYDRLAVWPLSVLMFAGALAAVPVPEGWPLVPGLGGLFGDHVLNACTRLTSILGPWVSDVVVGSALGLIAAGLTLPLIGLDWAAFRRSLERQEPEFAPEPAETEGGEPGPDAAIDDDDGEPGLGFGPSDELLAVVPEPMRGPTLSSVPGRAPALTVPGHEPLLEPAAADLGAPWLPDEPVATPRRSDRGPAASRRLSERLSTMSTRPQPALAQEPSVLEFGQAQESVSTPLSHQPARAPAPPERPQPERSQPERSQPERPQPERPLHVPFATDDWDDEESRLIAKRFAHDPNAPAEPEADPGRLRWIPWSRTQQLSERVEPTIERAALRAAMEAADKDEPGHHEAMERPAPARQAAAAVRPAVRPAPLADAAEPPLRRSAPREAAIAPPTQERRPAPPQAPTVTASPQALPRLGLLRAGERTRSGAERIEPLLKAKSAQLERVLADYGVKGTIVGARPGPVVTLYELEPAPGLKTARVVGLAEDIARSMATASARIAAIPGRNLIGIELPNDRRETVFLRDLLESDAFKRSSATLPVALGKGIEGEPIIADLARMPHLLVAGSTGSGKSVGINAIILSLLYRFTPEECRLILIDPKVLELSTYADIPHLLTPIVTEQSKAVAALGWAVLEMEERYKRMAKLNVRNIDTYNNAIKNAARQGSAIKRTVQVGFDRRTGEPMYEEEELSFEPLPYIVIVIDEMADLMLTAGKEFEPLVQRLAQMARAAGIHLVAATQRPSVDVVTGVIKANLPARLSYRVTSKIDSRTVLGESGAEQLLGAGDLLFNPGNGTIRAHGPFVADEEVALVTAELRRLGAPGYVDAVVAGAVEDGDDAADGPDAQDDDLYDRAVGLVAAERKASASFLQRRLQIGYNRAAGFIERMEQEGLVGPMSGGKRAILLPPPGAAA